MERNFAFLQTDYFKKIKKDSWRLKMKMALTQKEDEGN